MYTRLDVETTERSVTVRFTRAEKRNALDVATSQELGQALEEAADLARPLVLRSATPGMFVSGTDVAALRERTVETTLGRLNPRTFARLEQHPWPTIAVVDGWALGGGCELALACDIRITTPSARWGLPEVRLGIIPASGGLTRLADLIGGSIARDLVLTGRRIDGNEAHRIGLAQYLAEAEDLEEAVDSVLADLSRTSLFASRLAKEALRADGDQGRLVDAAALALCIGSDDAQRRMNNLLEGRAPDVDA